MPLSAERGVLRRAVRSRRARAWLAAVGVATCTLLVLVLAAAFRGVRGAMETYAGRPDVDLWIAPPGSDNLIRGSFASLIPDGFVSFARGLRGIGAADPIVKAFLPVKPLNSSDSTRRFTLLTIGYRTPDGLGGPPHLLAGRPPAEPGEAALDRAAAYRLGIGLGDTVLIANRRAAVVGLSTGTNILATQFAFTDIEFVRAAAGAGSGASFILIRAARGADPSQVAATILSLFPRVFVYPRAEFLAANRREVTSGFVPLVALVALLGIAAAAVLVGLLVSSVVEDRRTDIAVLLALGADLRVVGRNVLLHVLTLVCIGIAVGAILAVTVQALLSWRVPTIPLSLGKWDVLFVASVFFATGAIAAAVPVAKLGTIDPLQAFRP